MALTLVAHKIGKMCLSGMPVEVVKYGDTLSASGARFSSDLRYLHASILRTKRLVCPRLALKAHVHIWMPSLALFWQDPLASAAEDYRETRLTTARPVYWTVGTTSQNPIS